MIQGCLSTVWYILYSLLCKSVLLLYIFGVRSAAAHEILLCVILIFLLYVWEDLLSRLRSFVNLKIHELVYKLMAITLLTYMPLQHGHTKTVIHIAPDTWRNTTTHTSPHCHSLPSLSSSLPFYS